MLSVVQLERLDVGQVREYLALRGVDASRARFGVDARRVEYTTIDPHGQPTRASALVATPMDSGRGELVSWQHGTNPSRAEAASVDADSGDRAAAVMFAADGYVVSAPDYLGLGTGPGDHPYVDLPSTVTASVDALRATRALADRDGRRLTGDVLLSGHSQGGQAAMAVAKELLRAGEETLHPEAVAPISGPYDVSGTLHTAVTGGIRNGAAYLALLAVQWNRLHHLYDTPDQAFRSPYDRTVTGLVSGDHGSEQALRALPETPEQLFTPAFLALLRNPAGPLADALRVADGSCDWRPPTTLPVRIYAASGDQDVPIANATYCQRRIRAAGGAADVIDLGMIDHSASAPRALPMVLAGFDRAAS